jgi:hypothetical protein
MGDRTQTVPVKSLTNLINYGSCRYLASVAKRTRAARGNDDGQGTARFEWGVESSCQLPLIDRLLDPIRIVDPQS